ncbi:HsdM family class I SAM-dependent methyltransferase [Stenotrophomonas maltophilia]|uniref:HsdM family class I SAM-dependent methyltransferase n=1 Tax=Stenotrophomonas maltophilia TaxID=40324 RepID=UPI0025533116|nr:N-6 DNA methylase [Stenotrophomonas maltophilia]HEL5572038.1 N-6 DNA methylase [Stenotrophomonas maltophilia]
MGWNTRNPERGTGGQVYTQQECLDHPGLAAGLQRQRPEYVIAVREDSFWVIEAKAAHDQIDDAFQEALQYARDINAAGEVKAFIITGVAGNDDDGYLVRTAVLRESGRHDAVRYNGKKLTGLLSPDQAKYLVDQDTADLNSLVTDEVVLLSIAEEINNELHRASINKDLRATVMSAVLLSMVSDTLPNFSAAPEVFIKDINNRAEDVLINHAKREFAEYIELRLPHEVAAKEKYKAAVVRVFFLLRKINIKAAMDGSQDILGKFYEVFLKYGNGAKDIGIVLTPRHITEFAASVLAVSGDDLVYDPACGTGGFLVAAYDRVRESEPSKVEMFKKHRIFGVEQQANVAALAIVNMIFRGDGKNNIINGDCLSINLVRKIRNNEVSAEYQDDASSRPPVTKVLMNPPFALKREDEQEFTFVDHALDQMVDGGLLLAVLPLSVMYAGGKELAWRKRLLGSNSVIGVIGLPVDLFYPQASVESVVVILRKGCPQDPDDFCVFARILDDGFQKLKRKRLPHHKKSDLDTVRAWVADFIQGNSGSEILGVIQQKTIDMEDPYLELIPQVYLDNPVVSAERLKQELTRVQSEVVFQEVRRSLSCENI